MSRRTKINFFFSLGIALSSTSYADMANAPLAPVQSGPSAGNTEHYTATIQFFIQEPTPQLIRRSQRLAVRELTNTFRARHELELDSFDMKVSPTGNAIYLTIGSHKNIQMPVQNALASVITDLDGKVWAQGRGDVFKTSLSQPVEAILDIQLADTPLVNESGKAPDVGDVLVQRIVAVAVPVRDLLRTLKIHIIQDSRLSVSSFGHLMDRTCAERYIDWIFNESNEEPPKKLDALIEELAAVLNVPGGVEKNDDRYIFKGACPPNQPTYPRRATISLPFPTQIGPAAEMLEAGFRPMQRPGQAVNVEIPLMPLGRW